MMEEVANNVLPVSEPGGLSKAAFQAPVKMASTAEYGRIVIFKKDGTEAAVFSLTGEIKIGRDRNCDIRIKIPSVSRNHARIYQDENGNCNIENLSDTNVTTVNGVVHDSVVLKDGDIFCVGLREFVYQNGDNKRSTDNNDKLVARHVPVLETIDESLTLDIAKFLPMKTRGKPLTPIPETVNENLSPKKAVVEVIVQPVKSAEVDPFMIRAICNRRKSYNGPVEVPEKDQAVPKSVKSPGNSLKELNASTVRQMNNSIKNAINERRKSYSALTVTKSPKTPKVRTPAKKAVAVSESESMAVEEPSMSEAVEVEAEVMKTSTIDVLKSASKRTPAKEVDVVSVLVKSAKKTPIKVQTPQKTPIKSAAPTPSAPLSTAKEMEMERRLSSSPIRQAINARRRSSLSFECMDVSEAPVPVLATEEDQSQTQFDGITIMVPQGPKRDHTQTFTTTAISRRVSLGRAITSEQIVSKQSKRKSIAAPIYRSATYRLSLTKDDTATIATVAADSEPVPVMAEMTIDEDIVLSCKAADVENIVTVPLPVNALVTTPVKSVNNTERRGDAIKQAICVQLAVDAFANELEMQGVPAGRAYATAVDTYLSNPSDFSPKRVSVKAAPRRDSLLASLEDRAYVTGCSLYGADGGDESQLSCDLIAALTDSDMAIVDAYATRLEDAGGEPEEAYAIALDAFVRGVENCHMKVKVETAPMESSVQGAVSYHHQWNTLSRKIGPDGLNADTSLRALFDLPEDCEGRDETDNDETLVTRYAEGLRDEAFIDAAVAYGIALDTFLADPVAFRHHIGGVKQRLMEQYERAPFETPEYEYDLCYDDEAHSVAKSTIKKPFVPSNSHIFFTSPAFDSSPCKMASLYEQDEEDMEGDMMEVEVEVTTPKVEVIVPSNTHIFFNSPTPATTPLSMSPTPMPNASTPLPICSTPLPITTTRKSLPRTCTPLPKRSTPLPTESSPVPYEITSEECEVTVCTMAVDAEVLAVEVEVSTEVVEVEVSTEAICPSTPSTACFQSAFKVIKSAKKSPYISSVKSTTKTPTKTPIKALTGTPSKIPSKTPTKTPTGTRTKTPAKSPMRVPETVNLEVSVEAVVESVAVAVDASDFVSVPEIESVTAGDKIIEVQEEVVLAAVEEEKIASIPMEVQTLDLDSVIEIEFKEDVLIAVTESVSEEQTVALIEAVAPAPTTPVKVEAWLTSAAATLKKSLPLKSAHKSAQKSSNFKRQPTPRQSRLGQNKTPSKSDVTPVNLFQQESIDFAVTVPVAEIVSDLVVEMNAEVVVETIVEVVLEDQSAVVVTETTASEIESVEEIAVIDSVMTSSAITTEEAIEVQEPTILAINEITVETEAVVVNEVVPEVVVESVVEVIETVVEVIKVATPTPIRATRSRVAAVSNTHTASRSSSRIKNTVDVTEIAAITLAMTEEVTEEVAVAAAVEVVTIVSVPVTAPLSSTTPSRSTRSRAATPAVLSVVPTRSTRSQATATPSKVVPQVGDVVEVPVTVEAVIDVVVEVVEVSAPEIVLALPIIEVEVAPVEVEVEAITPIIVLGKGKRSLSTNSQIAAIDVSAKRSRRSEKSEAVFRADNLVPDMIVFACEEVPDMITFSDEVSIPVPVVEVVSVVADVVCVAVPTPKKSSVKAVQPRSTRKTSELSSAKKATAAVAVCEVPVSVAVEEKKEEKKEVRGRGRPSRAAVKAIEEKGEEEIEEEEALALLCDGCDTEHILEELGLTKIPDGDWFCTSCVEKKSTVPATIEKNERKSTRSSVAKSTPLKSNIAILPASSVSTKKRGIDVVAPSPAPEGRRSARLH